MKIPEAMNTTKRLIDDAISKRAREKQQRNYVGGSILGTSCDAALWYDIKHPVVIDDPRVNRIFDMGNLIEDYVIRLIEEAGITIHKRDSDGNQFGFIDTPIAGHIDGVLIGIPESSVPHLFENKSMNDSNFNKFKKEGLKNYSEKYWAQVQVYMHYMKLTRCLFVAMNKDNQELHFERVEYSEMEAVYYINRGKEIYAATERPPRRYNTKAAFGCKFCSHRDRCWID